MGRVMRSALSMAGHSLYKLKAEISKEANETSELPANPSRRNLEWSEKWEDMGQILKEFSDPIAWDFPSEQIQNPAEVAKYLKERCQGNTKEKRIITLSWALAYVYRTLLDTERQQTKDKEQGDKLVTIPITQAAASIPGSRPVVESDSRAQPKAVAANKRSRKCTTKTDRKVENDDDNPREGPSPKSETTSKGVDSEANINSFSLKDLRGLRKDYRRQPNESIISWKLVRLGPSEYASALAIMKQEETDKTVLDMAKKLRAYADAVHGPTHARIAAVETRLQKLKNKIEKNHKKLREEIKKDFLQISAVQIRSPGIQRRRSFDGERRYTPRAELWFFLRESGENMRRWDEKPTAALAQRVRNLKKGRIQRGSLNKQKAAPVIRSQDVKYDVNDDMSDPLERTSKTYTPGKKDNHA
ncbi:hypothetical protein HGM15179_014314 [Zosterops borbonicus]|uniref:Uncharacterized protein n=1 Tax=Zosterops borbonicus TaxID=364589 RepID=A0A8K1G7C6_9PASS|nr:hypothetical protein HGM15179_014314 [Zosterops borbonicus]